MAQDDGFLSRWSRRKVQLARGSAVAAADAPPQPMTSELSAPALRPAATVASAARAAGAHADLVDLPLAEVQPASTEPAAPVPPPPTLEDARQLTPEADFTRFVGRDVDPQVKNLALKKLFSDPQFNVMDGLDIYIDDYGIPDPLPPGMLERMTQSAFLGLFRKTPEEEAAARAQARAPAPETPAEAASDPATALPTAPEQAPAAPTDPLDPDPDEDPDLRLQRHDDAGRPGPVPGAEPNPGRQR